MPGRTPEGDALTALVLPAFELNGEFLSAAALIGAPHALTPAQWQVLGAVLETALTVSDVARRIGLGLTRQSVQRVANDVVRLGWAEWSDNPAHQRAKLLSPTEAGRDAVGAMANEQHAWANYVGAIVGRDELGELERLIQKVIAASRNYRDRSDSSKKTT